MKKQIKLSDLHILLHLMAPKRYNLFIFDPEGKLEEDVKEHAYDEQGVSILVNLGGSISSLRGSNLSEFNMIVDFGSTKVLKIFSKMEFGYMNFRGGGMRWVYPKGKGTSSLVFYNTSSLKSKLNASAVRTAFKLKMDRVLGAGKFTIYSQCILKTTKIFNELKHEHICYFMGTPGINRTPVAALFTKKVATHFVKFALDKSGYNLIQNERQTLSRLSSKSLKYINIPQTVEHSEKAVLIASNIKPPRGKRSQNLLAVHYKALEELFHQGTLSMSIYNSALWDNIVHNVSLIRNNHPVVPESGNLKHLMLDAIKKIDPEKSIMLSAAHGDFTPWNMYVEKDQIHLYDWELQKNPAPALFDLFHFHFQTGIYQKKWGAKKIIGAIETSIENPRIKALISTYRINIQLHIKLYTLRIASYYVALYQQKNLLTEENKLQIKIWSDVLKNLETEETEVDNRKVFIEEFKFALKRTPHTYLKFDALSTDFLSNSSDLDLLILKEDIPNILTYCQSHRFAKRVLVVKKSFMTVVNLFLKDGSFMSIDLIHQFKRKNLEMMDSRSVLISAKPNKYNVHIPALKYDLEYCMLFYNLNMSGIPDKYLAHFSNDTYASKNNALNHLNEKYNLEIERFEELFEYSTEKRRRILKVLRKSKSNRGLSRIKNTVLYIMDTVKSFFNNRGMIITFSGVDGAGKTTIINRVKNQIETQYRREVVLLRHRPGILPILSSIKHGKKEAEHRASITLPRTGGNKRKLSSLLRFSYYYTDYLIGQIYVYMRYILRGKVVLYDRYYFDFINDSKRSNIKLNTSFTKWLYRFILKPKLNFFLYADAEVILARKQELKKQDIVELSEKYKTLFTDLDEKYTSSSYIPIRNLKLENTLSTVINAYTKVA